MAYLPTPGEQFGRYRIVSRIGRGGMGSVYEARESGLDRPVALKILSSDLADEGSFRSRFLREARILASLDSPHVIQVYEQGEHDGRLYIATQLVKGSDLHQLIEASGPMPPGEALALMAQVADGLTDAHEAGLLHRDVKPSNVLVRTGRGEAFAYLCDFGIAVQPDSHHTRTSGVIGTVDYMAPERHEGRDASVASDIYSLGCVLWATLSGRAPYAGTSAVRVAMAHMSQPVPVYGGATPAAALVNQILTRSMAKDPSQRYPSAAEMRRDLVQAGEVARGVTTVSPGTGAAGTMTEVRSYGTGPTPAREPARRRAWLATAGAVLAIALVGGLGYVLTASRDDGRDTAAPGAGPSSSSAPQVTQTETPASGAPTTTTTTTGTRTPRPRATTTATVTLTPSSAPAVVAPPVATVSCWDGSSAAAAASCPVPSGRAGMETVFPSLATDSTCQPVTASVSGKAEVYECIHGNVLLRYSRWVPQADRYGYYDASNGLPGSQWFIGEEFGGRQWTSYDGSSGESRRYQWSAAYRFSPFSVSVEGVTDADRTDGKRLVQVASPSHIGLP